MLVSGLLCTWATKNEMDPPSVCEAYCASSTCEYLTRMHVHMSILWRTIATTESELDSHTCIVPTSSHTSHRRKSYKCTPRRSISTRPSHEGSRKQRRTSSASSIKRTHQSTPSKVTNTQRPRIVVGPPSVRVEIKTHCKVKDRTSR